ncbi:two-component system sensor histidine kinase NtrB [Paracraurococcus lichenis]|uniref:histidine kinase n=1 Tax=Paracraurococcus lichenis TaxID=3064888 RepID=A0ABT9EBS2_9PROT|nr:ATP-binding protein [Paracraurococcus sp. LOR1-02]MDO9713629.1 PAS domain S-box protein [Paracraurococcus sp. LOR1-02]
MSARRSNSSAPRAKEPADISNPGSILVVAPIGRDAAEIGRVLDGMGVATTPCADLAALCDELRLNGGTVTSALVIAEEALARGSDALVACLARQPSWSDLPIMVLTTGGRLQRSGGRWALFEGLGNVTLLDRPLHPETLRSAARNALRARARQYETRRHLEALQLAAETLEARVEDRTRALAAEAAERARAEASYRALYQQTPIPLHSLDAEGRLLSVSDRWLAFIGYSGRDEVVGHCITEFMTEEAARQHREAHWPRLLAEGGFNDVEYRLIKRSGEIADVLVSARIEHDEVGRFVRTMAALVDITARKRAEEKLALEAAKREAAQERLRQTQKMEALGQLAGGVAHDFNNASAAVLAGIALLEKRHGATFAAAGPGPLRLLAGLRDGAERGAAVSRRLLSFARREALNATNVDPAELLSGLRDMLANALGPGIRMRAEAPAGLPALRADRRQLETVLINLAINARDAMPPEGGEVVFAATPEVVDSSTEHPAGLQPGRYIRLSIADTGSGMDAATLARATEPFFTTKPADRGTGLGLSMTSGFAEQSGGALRLESEPRRGTTVTLWLPQAEAATVTAMPPPAAGMPSRALIVDAVPLTRRYLVHCLREAGWDAAEAASAGEALEVIDADTSFGLLCIAHPTLSGPDSMTLARAARVRRPGLPTMLVAGPEVATDFAAEALNEGLRVLRKPVSPMELQEVLAGLKHRSATWPRSEAAD